MTYKKAALCGAAVALLTAATLQAESMVFTIAPGKPNLVKFTSVAQLETIVGTTDQISGSLVFDPRNLAAGAKAECTVDMASLDTDNRIRNGHMRDNHLHTDRFPTSRFVLTEILPGAPNSLPDGVAVSFRIAGEFTCHGVTRRVEPEVTTVWSASERTLDVTARFDVLLKDYDIPRPQFLVLKLDERQQVNVKFQARAK